MKRIQFLILISLLTFTAASCGKEDKSGLAFLFAYLLQKQPQAPAPGGGGPVSWSTTDCAYTTGKGNGPATGKLLITEIKLCYGWIELHNGTSSDITLSDYKLKVDYSYNTSSFDYDTLYDLPAVVIPSGDFFIIRSDTSNSKYDYRDVLSLKNAGGFSPAFYTSSGYYIELLKNGATVDYININEAYPAPATASEWSGSAIAPATCDTLRRDTNFSDTNQASDWTLGTLATPHLPNTAQCGADADLDGLPDCAEASADQYYRGYSYYNWGARTSQKDLFIEMDYMDQSDPDCLYCPDKGFRPLRETLDEMKTRFAAQGWTVHYDVGDLFDNDGISGNNPANYDLCNGGQIPHYSAVDFNPPAGVEDIMNVKYMHMINERRQNFHYMLFADTCNADYSNCGFWGRASRPGNTALITQRLGNDDAAYAKFYQFSTVMHELGHNLGLAHGGFETTNYKPNYLSIMNYLYSFVPPADSWAPLPYYSFARYTMGMTSCSSLYTYSGYPYFYTNTSTRNFIDYSTGTAVDLDESSLDESFGYGGSYPQVDFNCSGSIESGVSQDLNNDSILGVLQDNDDWGTVAIFSEGSTDIAYTPADAPAEVFQFPFQRHAPPSDSSRKKNKHGRKKPPQGYARSPEGRIAAIRSGVGQHLLVDERLSESMVQIDD